MAHIRTRLKISNKVGDKIWHASLAPICVEYAQSAGKSDIKPMEASRHRHSTPPSNYNYIYRASVQLIKGDMKETPQGGPAGQY